MTQRQQQDLFSEELSRLVDRFAGEFELSYASVIGCIELEKAKLLNELLNPELYEEEDDNY